MRVMKGTDCKQFYSFSSSVPFITQEGWGGSLRVGPMTLWLRLSLPLPPSISLSLPLSLPPSPSLPPSLHPSIHPSLTHSLTHSLSPSLPLLPPARRPSARLVPAAGLGRGRLGTRGPCGAGPGGPYSRTGPRKGADAGSGCKPVPAPFRCPAGSGRAGLLPRTSSRGNQGMLSRFASVHCF